MEQRYYKYDISKKIIAKNTLILSAHTYCYLANLSTLRILRLFI